MNFHRYVPTCVASREQDLRKIKFIWSLSNIFQIKTLVIKDAVV